MGRGGGLCHGGAAASGTSTRNLVTYYCIMVLAQEGLSWAGEVACVVAVPPHLGPLLMARAVHGAGVAVQATGLELTLGDISTPPTRARTLGLRQVLMHTNAKCRP